MSISQNAFGHRRHIVLACAQSVFIATSQPLREMKQLRTCPDRKAALASLWAGQQVPLSWPIDTSAVIYHLVIDTLSVRVTKLILFYKRLKETVKRSVSIKTNETPSHTAYHEQSVNKTKLFGYRVCRTLRYDVTQLETKISLHVHNASILSFWTITRINCSISVLARILWT